MNLKKLFMHNHYINFLLALRSALGLISISCLFASTIAAAFEQANAPVTVKVIPEVAMVKSKITVSGTSLALGKNTDVTITIALAGGVNKSASKTMKANVDAKGNFKTEFIAEAEGKYQVIVTAPDGKGTASATIQIAKPLTALAAASASAGALIATMQQGQAAADAQLNSLPPSPPKDEVQQKSAELKKKLAEIPAAQKQYESALSKLYELGANNPETLPGLQPLFDELAADSDAIKEQNDAFEKRLAQGGKKNATCDSIEAATEAFSALSTSMNLIGKPWEKLRNFLIDKGPGKVVDAVPNSASDTTKLAITQGFKLSASIMFAGAAGGPVAIALSTIGLAGDIGQFFTQQKFAKYCEKFEGPVYAQYRSEFRHKGKPYLTYKFDLRGKIQLRYIKDASRKDGDPIALTGQIEGVLEKTEYAEDAIILEPQLKSRVLLRKIIAPPGVPYLEDVGTMARMSMPNGFYIPIKGEMQNGKIIINVEEATKDLSDIIQAQILYVFVEPALPIPSVQKIKAPLQKARFILDRGMRAKPTFEVVTTKDQLKIERSFTRTEDLKNADALIDFKVDVKACNPTCLPSLYFGKAK
jgi:hypothetical protein